jgi:hypothetical protein
LSAQTDILLSFGFEYGNFLENTDNWNIDRSYMGAPGVTQGTYIFWNNHNIGLFVHDSFLFPVKKTAELDAYDFVIQAGVMAGPGFRYTLNETIQLLMGIGLGFNETIGTYNEYDAQSKSSTAAIFKSALGIGGDFCVTWNITDLFYLNTGCLVSYDFFNHVFKKSSLGNESNVDSAYARIGIRPYIGIGLNIHLKKDFWKSTL